MLSNQVNDRDSLLALWRTVRGASAVEALSAALAIIGVAILLDYGWMLWLRSKMVG